MLRQQLLVPRFWRPLPLLAPLPLLVQLTRVRPKKSEVRGVSVALVLPVLRRRSVVARVFPWPLARCVSLRAAQWPLGIGGDLNRQLNNFIRESFVFWSTGSTDWMSTDVT